MSDSSNRPGDSDGREARGRNGTLRGLIDRGPVGYITTGAHGVIEAINTTLLDWLGLERVDVVGVRTFQGLLPPGGRIYHDTHLRPLLEMQNEFREIAVELVRADRSRLPVLINAVRRAGSTDEGEQIEIVVFDASERRRYEQELLSERRHAERSERRLQLLYDIVTGLASATTTEEVVSVIRERGAGSEDGVTCAVWLLDAAEAGASRVGAPHDDAWTLADHLDFPEGGGALDLLRRGDLVVIANVETEHRYPLLTTWLKEARRSSALIAPLRIGDRLHGVLSYGMPEAHEFDASERQAVVSLAAQAQQALGRAWLIDAERRSRARLEGLFRFTTLLSEAISIDEVIAVIADQGMLLLGALGVRVATHDESTNAVRFVRGTGVGGSLDTSTDLASASIGCEVIRTGDVVLTETRDELAARFPASPILADLSFGRVIAAPLRRGEAILGAWVLAFADEGAPDADDLTIIRLYAEQAGHAIRRAASHENESIARRQSDLRRFISETLNAAATTRDVGQAITTEGRRAFDADAIAVFALDEADDADLLLVAQDGLDDAAIQRIPRAMSAVARSFESRRPVFIVEQDDLRTALADPLNSDRWSSVGVLPLLRSGRPDGVILVFFERSDQLSSATRLALTGMAAEASVALGRAREYDLEHQVAVTLQRSMMQFSIPQLDGWRIDASYAPGSSDLLVGGDLFDVSRLPDGRVLIVVADVVGHGLAAAAAMGQLRSAAKVLSLSASSPGTVLEGLDRFAALTPGVMHASVCCVILASDGAGQYACAGHPYPILVTDDGATSALREGRSALIGVPLKSSEPDGRPEAELFLDEGSTLVMYTDGLVERRASNIDQGIDRLRSHLARRDFSQPDDHAHEIVRAMGADDEHEDDIVVVRVTRAVAPPAD